MPTTYESYYFSAGAGVNLGTRRWGWPISMSPTSRRSTSSSSAGPKNGGDMGRGAVCTTPLWKRYYLAATLSFRF